MFGLFDRYSLCRKMRKAAKKNNLPKDHALRVLADKLEAVIGSAEKTPETIIEAYSEARKAYNEFQNSKK